MHSELAGGKESHQAMAAMQSDPVAREHMGRAAAIADGFEPHLYSVESVHHRPNSRSRDRSGCCRQRDRCLTG